MAIRPRSERRGDIERVKQIEAARRRKAEYERDPASLNGWDYHASFVTDTLGRNWNMFVWDGGSYKGHISWQDAHIFGLPWRWSKEELKDLGAAGDITLTFADLGHEIIGWPGSGNWKPKQFAGTSADRIRRMARAFISDHGGPTNFDFDPLSIPPMTPREELSHRYDASRHEAPPPTHAIASGPMADPPPKLIPHLPECGIASPRHPGGFRCHTSCPHYQDPPVTASQREQARRDDEAIARGEGTEPTIPKPWTVLVKQGKHYTDHPAETEEEAKEIARQIRHTLGANVGITIRRLPHHSPTIPAREFISAKIRELRHEGYPQRQAVAVALEEARKAGYRSVPKNPRSRK